MASPRTSTVLSLLTISTALIASGGIATLTLFDIPIFKSQPASRSLPSTRWLFSRGSHIFPAASVISASGFAYLAYSSLPAVTSRIPVRELLTHGRVPGYILAALLTMSIGPWTTLVMVPTNFRLIEINERIGGSRSEESAKTQAGSGKTKTAEESVDGKDDVSQFKDLSGPMERTDRQATKEEEQEVRELLGKFGWMNGVRALLMGLGGMVGLWTALI